MQIISDLVQTVDQMEKNHGNEDEESNTHLEEFDRMMTENDEEPEEEVDGENHYYTTQISNYVNSNSPKHDTLLTDFRMGARYRVPGTISIAERWHQNDTTPSGKKLRNGIP